MHQKIASSVLVALVVSACADSTSPTNAGRLAPLVDATADQTYEAVPNEWVVVLKRGADAPTEAAAARAAGAHVIDVWKASLNGFAIRANASALAAIRRNRLIDFVQPNLIMHVDAAQPCAPYLTCSWGLDRIDETGAPLDGVYNLPAQAPNQGAGVHAYTIDTGIRTTHTQFGGRAVSGYDFVNNDPIANDDNGHGTHVSGTIGGADYGVAKQVNLVGVKVCTAGGTCPTNVIVSGVNWVQVNAIHPAVANMSLGGSANAAIDNAVAAAIASGVTFGIAAGNSYGANACNYSPARVPAAITVASSGNGNGTPPAQLDNRSSFSNIGTCVDIFAPGNNIRSAWNTNDTATNTISGTSMATPHVVGAAALYLDVRPGATPAQVAAAMVANATNGVIVNAGAGSPNKLLNVSRPARP